MNEWTNDSEIVPTTHSRNIFSFLCKVSMITMSCEKWIILFFFSKNCRFKLKHDENEWRLNEDWIRLSFVPTTHSRNIFSFLFKVSMITMSCEKWIILFFSLEKLPIQAKTRPSFVPATQSRSFSKHYFFPFESSKSADDNDFFLSKHFVSLWWAILMQNGYITVFLWWSFAKVC